MRAEKSIIENHLAGLLAINAERKRALIQGIIMLILQIVYLMVALSYKENTVWISCYRYVFFVVAAITVKCMLDMEKSKRGLSKDRLMKELMDQGEDFLYIFHTGMLSKQKDVLIAVDDNRVFVIKPMETDMNWHFRVSACCRSVNQNAMLISCFLQSEGIDIPVQPVVCFMDTLCVTDAVWRNNVLVCGDIEEFIFNYRELYKKTGGDKEKRKRIATLFYEKLPFEKEELSDWDIFDD